MRSSSSSQRALSSSSSEGASRGSGARAAMSESVMRESAPSSRSRRRQPETAAAVTPASAARSAARSPASSRATSSIFLSKGKYTAFLRGGGATPAAFAQFTTAVRLQPASSAASVRLNPAATASTASSLVSNGEHADSNPDTGVSNFLSAPPTRSSLPHFSRAIKNASDPFGKREKKGGSSTGNMPQGYAFQGACSQQRTFSRLRALLGERSRGCSLWGAQRASCMADGAGAGVRAAGRWHRARGERNAGRSRRESAGGLPKAPPPPRASP